MADAPVREDPCMTRRIATQTLALFLATAAHAATLSTPPLHPDAGGKLSCTVVNVGSRDIGIAAQIVSDGGENVTDFAANQYQDPDDQVLASVVVESTAGAARYCKVTVSGGGARRCGRRRGVRHERTRTAVVEAAEPSRPDGRTPRPCIHRRGRA
jgi:hypothetical protein